MPFSKEEIMRRVIDQNPDRETFCMDRLEEAMRAKSLEAAADIILSDTFYGDAQQDELGYWIDGFDEDLPRD